MTVTLNGEFLWHDTVWISAQSDAAAAGKKGFDFDPMFAGVRAHVASSDAAICHEEVPFAPDGGPYLNYPLFAAPPAIAPWIKSFGYDLCTTASNHSLDQGFEGLTHTLDVLDAAGIPHAGTARTAAEAKRPTIIKTTSGVTVAVVIGTYSTNGMPTPPGAEWAVNLLSADALLAQAKSARKAGADIVLAAMHGGDEYQELPNEQQRTIADVLTKSSDIDLVYGHHVHRVQPFEQCNGKWVLYGLGNMIAQGLQSNPETYEGLIVKVTFVGRAAGSFVAEKVEYVPTVWNHISTGPIRVVAISDALQTGKLPPGLTAKSLQVSLERTRATVGKLGAKVGQG